MHRIIYAVLVVILFVGLSYGQTKINNFDQVNDRIYRGAQPSEEDLSYLKLVGINTVINLRDDPKSYEEPVVKSLGMKYVNIPMSGWMYPRESDIQHILKLLNSPTSGKIFIHCKAGIHRTGVAIAVYEIQHGYTYEQASKEMKTHLWFGITALLHIRLRCYVKDYAKR